ncbi:MAG: FHA domain-containing protein [Myxococcaceae bacterium]|nr:FHA domain-containing protein [Myxococcaceae bacterium]
MLSGWLESHLVRRLAHLGRDGFLIRHALSWLVWEPGRWTPSSSLEAAAVAETLPVTSARLGGPRTNDGLCFELNPLHSPIKVGRSPDCTIVIDDATLSRVAFELIWHQSRWWMNPLTHRPVWVDGVEVREPVGIDAQRLVTGEVVFATPGPVAMVERLARRPT